MYCYPLVAMESYRCDFQGFDQPITVFLSILGFQPVGCTWRIIFAMHEFGVVFSVLIFVRIDYIYSTKLELKFAFFYTCTSCAGFDFN